MDEAEPGSLPPAVAPPSGSDELRQRRAENEPSAAALALSAPLTPAAPDSSPP